MNRILALCALILLAVAPCAHAQETPSVQTADYCVKKGGVVQTRIPTFNTNGGTQFPLAGAKQFCDFTAKNGDSSIWVILDTLYTKKPTLAALAYYAEVPFNGSTCVGSPGSCYCSQIGGTDLFGGINASGGGWVLNTDSTDVLDACIFPDLSVIDSYGLFYHSAGIVRGKDLSKVLRYKNPNG